MSKCSNNCDSCGNCSRCGECCTPLIPISRKEEKRIREYINLHNIEPEPFIENKDMNLLCCFYDRKNKLCKIYDVRPSICRSFKCNRNLDVLEREKAINHERAYWNRMVGDKTEHLTDMRLLFYDDSRSLLGNMIYVLSRGTMKLNKEGFEFLKLQLRLGGQEKLVESIEAKWGE